MIRPNKLQVGDEIRVIAPSRSIKILSEDGIVKAQSNLEKLGFKVTFGKNIEVCDLQNSSSIEERIADLHDAFKDPNVKGILTVIGGFNSNELLPYLDYELIQNNPKILCGFSDVTALATAIYTKCGFITYSGPHFSSFGMEGLQAYQTKFFQQALMNNTPFLLEASEQWSDDAWYIDQENRIYEAGEWKVYSEGEATGHLIGGNLCTLNLLQGTEYMPDLDNSILFVEDDELIDPQLFARDLTSLLQIEGNIKGLLIGRFQNVSKVTKEQLYFILDKHPLLQQIPVMYDIDFGHTQPILTLPIGGEVHVDTKKQQIKLLAF